MADPQRHDHRAAFVLQRLGSAVLAGLALWALVALLTGLRDAAAMRGSWPGVDGVYGGWGGEGLIEVEVSAADAARLPPLPRPAHAAPYQPGHVRVLLPDRPYSRQELAGPVRLAVRPGQAEVVVVDALADAAMALARAVWALLLGALAWWVHRRLDWGRDLTWDGHGWAAERPSAAPPGSRAPESQRLHPTRLQSRWAGLLTALFGALLLAHLAGLVVGDRSAPIEAGFVALALGFVFAIGLGQTLTSRTQVVQWDDSGIAERSWFATRRLPWSAIAGWQRVNKAAEAQRRYDSQSLSRRKGSRPTDHWVWAACDAQGGHRLEIDETLEPAAAMAALQRRIARHADRGAVFGAMEANRPLGHGRADDAHSGVDVDADAGADEPDDDDHDHEAAHAHEAQFDALQAQVARGFRWGFVAVVAPFVLMFLWPTWNAIGYQFLAERVQGTVVAADQGSAVPQLTVRYPAPDGSSLELRTDGSRAYQGIAPGAGITVLRPRSAPEDAKVAAFWEVWIWPVITGVLLLVVAVPFSIGFILGPRREAKARAASATRRRKGRRRS